MQTMACHYSGGAWYQLLNISWSQEWAWLYPYSFLWLSPVVPIEFLDLPSHLLLRKTSGWRSIFRNTKNIICRRVTPYLLPLQRIRQETCMCSSSREAWILSKAGLIRWQCEFEQVPEKGCFLEPLQDFPCGNLAERRFCKDRVVQLLLCIAGLKDVLCLIFITLCLLQPHLPKTTY